MTMPCLNEQPIIFAKKMHELRYVYALYGLLDGQFLAYSSFKYFFDLISSDKPSAREASEWLATPVGIVGTLIGSGILVSLSLAANSYDPENSNDFIKKLSKIWPTCRGIINDLRDVNKVVSNTLKIAAFLNETELNRLMMPTCLLVSAVSMMNRFWTWQIDEQRKKIKEELARLLSEVIAGSNGANSDDLSGYQTALLILASQSNQQRQFAYLAAFYSGVIESLALNFTTLMLVSLSSPVFIPAASFCIVFSFAIIVSQLYQEYEAQRSLELDRLQVDLVLKQKEMDALQTGALAGRAMGAALSCVVQELALLRQKINANKPSMLTQALAGLKDGLAVYVVVNQVFVVLLMCASTISTALLMSNFIVGAAILVGFLAHALIKHYRQATPDKEMGLGNDICLADHERAQVKLTELFNEHSEAVPQSSPCFETTLDILYAFFSGLRKRQKSIGYALIEALAFKNQFDSSILLGLSTVSAVLGSLILALRTYTVSFGTTKKSTEAEEVHVEIELEVLSEQDPAIRVADLQAQSNALPAQSSEVVKVAEEDEETVTDTTPLMYGSRRSKVFAPKLTTQQNKNYFFNGSSVQNHRGLIAHFKMI